MLQAYREHIDERAQQGIPPTPLDAQQTADLVELIKNPPAGEENYLLELLTQHIPAGVDEAAYVKSGFLVAITRGDDDRQIKISWHGGRIHGEECSPRITRMGTNKRLILCGLPSFPPSPNKNIHSCLSRAVHRGKFA